MPKSLYIHVLVGVTSRLSLRICRDLSKDKIVNNIVPKDEKVKNYLFVCLYGLMSDGPNDHNVIY